MNAHARLLWLLNRPASFVTPTATIALAMATSQSLAGTPALDGFYRQNNEAAVYHLFQGDRACAVTTPDQLRILGGEGHVQVRSNTDFLTKRVKTGHCGWPAGYYKAANGPAIWKVTVEPTGQTGFQGFACRVENPSQLRAFGAIDRVWEVKELGNRKTRAHVLDFFVVNSATCSWPPGIYRRKDESAVHFLNSANGGSVCRVQPHQVDSLGGWSRVIVVEPGSNLMQWRFLGKCP